MKIICVGRNYAEHAKELNNKVPSEPIIFLKPDTSLLRPGQHFYMPDFSNQIDYEVELVIKIQKEGKYIEHKFAHKYYEEVCLGIDFTARDLQQKARNEGTPWTLAKGFNGSAPVSEPKSLSEIGSVRNLLIRLDKNGETVQSASTSEMIFDPDTIVSYVSKFMTLKKGDLIFTGTPAGVGPVKIGDLLEGYINNEKILSVEIH